MKTFLGLASLIGIGFGVGYAVGDRHGRKKAREEQEQASQQQAPAPQEEPKPEIEQAEDIAKQQNYIPDEPEQESEEDMEAAKAAMDAYLAEGEAPYEEEEDEDKPPVQVIEDLVDIYFDEDVWNSEIEYSQVELMYYSDDEVLCDENENIIGDPEEILGKDALPTLESSSLRIIYVKNHWDQKLYRITRIDDAYGRIVAGFMNE